MGNTIKHSVLPSIIQCANITINRHEIPSAVSSNGIITNNITNNKNGTTINKSDGITITTISTPTNPTLEPTQQSTNKDIISPTNITTICTSTSSTIHLATTTTKASTLTITNSDNCNNIQIHTINGTTYNIHKPWKPTKPSSNLKGNKNRNNITSYDPTIYPSISPTIQSTTSEASKQSDIQHSESSIKSKAKCKKRRRRGTNKISNKSKSKNNNKYKQNKINISNKRNSKTVSSSNRSKSGKVCKSSKPNKPTSNIKDNKNRNNPSCNPSIYPSISPTIQSTNHHSNILSTSPTLELTTTANTTKKLTLKQRKARKRNVSITSNYRGMTQTQKTMLLKQWDFVHGINIEEDDDNNQSRTISIWLNDETNEVIKNWYTDNPMMDNNEFYAEPIDCGNNIIIYIRKGWKPTKSPLTSIKHDILQEQEEEEEIYELYNDEYLDFDYISYCGYGQDLVEEQEEDMLMALNRDPDTMNDAEFISYLREKCYMCSKSDPTPISTATDKPILATSHKITTPPKIIKQRKTPKPPNEHSFKVNINNNNNKTRNNNTGYDIVNDKDILTEDYTEQIVAGQVAEVISSSFRNTGAPVTGVLSDYVDNVGLSASGTQSSCDDTKGYIKVHKETNDDRID